MRRLECTRALSAEDAPAIAASLAAGELLIYPTDTLYALGGLVLDVRAGARVRAAKTREAGKPLPAVAADLAQVQGLCTPLSGAALALAGAFWPGPLTLVLPASPDVPVEVTAGGGTIAVRVPGRELTRSLCRLAGALISTSANVAGQPAPVTCAEAAAEVGPAAAWAVDAGAGSPIPSTIVDATGDAPRLLRAGVIPWDSVRAAWSARP